MNIKNQIKKALEVASGIKNPEVDFSSNDQFGDYSSNIALRNKDLNPQEIADKINQKDLPFSAKVVGRFVNFFIKNDVLVDNLMQIDHSFGKSEIGKGKTAIVEYSSANIAKPFTVGHLRSTIIGDAVANILDFSGWKVLRDNHLGDWGTQFGKQIYAIKTWGKGVNAEYSVKELVNLYVKFHEEAEKDPSIEDKAREWFKKLEDGDGEARNIWKKCVEWSFAEFDRIYEILGIKFSQEFENGRGLGESFFESRISGVIDELKQKNLLKEGEKGARLVFFENDKYPPAMILKKDGATLYHTRDLATDKYRLEKYNPDLIINEVGLEQKLYFEQLYEMEKMLGWYKNGQRYHLGHGLIRFKDGKMSTRKGNVVWMEDLLQIAKTKARDMRLRQKPFENNSKNPQDTQILNVDEQVAIGALKYNDLKRDPKTEIIFDWDEILNMEGNSGPYLQYTIARCNSIMAKSPITNYQFSMNFQLNNEEEIILRNLIKFPEIIENSALNYSPNILCSYLYDLASKFNSFYNKHKIIGVDQENFRLKLTQSVSLILKNGLKLLGIEAPERM